MLVDDSQPVTNLMVVICTKIGTSHTQHKQRNIFVIFIFLVHLNPREREREREERKAGEPLFEITR
jgi:hypothetical protein